MAQPSPSRGPPLANARRRVLTQEFCLLLMVRIRCPEAALMASVYAGDCATAQTRDDIIGTQPFRPTKRAERRLSRAELVSTRTLVIVSEVIPSSEVHRIAR